ncbi:MAG: hypothetical protein ACOYJC_11650 [Christensenellales bacterium]|jgi:hypothetical protein
MNKQEAIEFLQENGFQYDFGLGAISSWKLDDLSVTVSLDWIDANSGAGYVENEIHNLEKLEIDKTDLVLYFRGGTIVALRRTR